MIIIRLVKRRNKIFFYIFILISLSFHLSISWSFRDDFIYSTIEEMENSGWIVHNKDLVELKNSTVILHNTCDKASWLRYHIPPSRMFIATSIGKWVSGPYQSIHLLLFSQNHSYNWWYDGYYSKLIFQIDGRTVFEKIFSIPKNKFYNLTTISNGTHWELYFDNKLYYIHKINDTIIKIGVNSAWCSVNAYDKIIFISKEKEMKIGKIDTLIVPFKNLSSVLFFQGKLFLYHLNKIEPFLKLTNSSINKTIFVNFCPPNYLFRCYSMKDLLLNFYKINESVTCSSPLKETCLYANLLSSYLHLPYFDERPSYLKVKYNITTKEQALNILFDYLKKEKREIMGIIVVNIQSDKIYFANRIAPFINAFPIYVNLSNINNESFYIREKIIETVEFLNKHGFMFNSSSYKNGKIPFVIIVGNETEIPFFNFTDLTLIPSIDYFLGYYDDYILTDSPYCNFNRTANFKEKTILIQYAICSRLFSDLPDLFFQFEMQRKPLPKKVLIINDYSVPEDIQFFYYDNMRMGFELYYSLKDQGIEVKRVIEKRSGVEEINITILEDLIEYLVKNYIKKKIEEIGKKIVIRKIIGILSMLRDYFHILSYTFEFDWEEGLERFFDTGEFRIKSFPSLTKKDLDYPVIIYFANSTRDGTKWFFGNLSLSWKNTSSIFIFNCHHRSYHLKNTTSKKIVEDYKIPLLSFTTRMLPGGFSFFVKKLLENVSFPLGYSFWKTKNYMIGIQHFIKGDPAIMMWFYYKLSLSPIYSGLPNLSFVSKPIIPKETFIPKKERKDEFSVLLPFLEQPECWIIEYENKSYALCSKYYLRVEGYPLIPIYVKEIVLPKNSELKNVAFYYDFEKFENVEIPIFGNYSNFTKFPKNFVSFYSFKTFENETVVEIVYSPIIYFSNKTALILKDLSAKVTYTAPLEIYGIKFLNKTENSTLKLLLKIFSKEETKAKVGVQINNKTKSFEIKLKQGGNYFSFDLFELSHGKYTAKILVETPKNYVIKLKEVTIKRKEIEHKPFYAKFFEHIISPLLEFFGIGKKKKVFMMKLNESCVKFKINKHYKFEILKCGNTFSVSYSDLNGYYKAERSPNMELENVLTKNGELVLKIFNGKFYFDANGNLKELKKDLEYFRDRIVDVLFENEITW